MNRWRKFHTAVVNWTRVGDSYSYRLRQTLYRGSLSFCKNLLENPEHWDEHCKQAAVFNGLSMVYGTIPGDNPGEKAATIDATQDFVARITNAARPGTFAVDMIPWLEYLPSVYVPLGYGRII